MTKNVSLLVIFALANFALINSLVLHRKMNQNHLERLQNHKAYHLVHQRMSKLLHLDSQSEEQVDMNGPVGDFFMWMMSDKDVVDSATNQKPLPDKTAENIRTYLLDHPEIIDQFINRTEENDENSADCLKKLDKEQKKKFYGWILQEIDFKNMFLQDSDSLEIGEEEKEKLTERAMNDPELGPVFSQCGKTSPSS